MLLVWGQCCDLGQSRHLKKRVDYAREAIGLVFSPGYYKSTIGIYSEIDSARYKSSLKKKHLGR